MKKILLASMLLFMTGSALAAPMRCRVWKVKHGQRVCTKWQKVRTH